MAAFVIIAHSPLVTSPKVDPLLKVAGLVTPPICAIALVVVVLLFSRPTPAGVNAVQSGAEGLAAAMGTRAEGALPPCPEEGLPAVGANELPNRGLELISWKKNTLGAGPSQAERYEERKLKFTDGQIAEIEARRAA